MASNRLTRVNQLLQREIAVGVFKVINVEGFDMSTVTITRVFTSPDLRHARVLVSIRGKDEEVRQHLNLLKKFRVDLQQEVDVLLVVDRQYLPEDHHTAPPLLAKRQVTWRIFVAAPAQLRFVAFALPA